MSTNSQTLAKNIALLKDKGFYNKRIPGNIPSFAKWFEISLNICLIKGKTSEENIEFTMPVTGFFRKEKDIVSFDFKYEYDPKINEVNLKLISARMGSVSRDFQIENPVFDLPHAKEIHQSLLNDLLNKPVFNDAMKNLVETGMLSRRDLHAIDNICNDQQRELQEKGYLITPPIRAFDQDHFWKKLQNKLAFAVNYPLRSPFLFTIPTSRYFNNEKSKTTFEFTYKFDPELMKIQLKSVHAHMHQIKHLQIVSGNQDLQSANWLYQTMSAQKLFKDTTEKFSKIFKKKTQAYPPGKSIS